MLKRGIFLKESWIAVQVIFSSKNRINLQCFEANVFKTFLWNQQNKTDTEKKWDYAFEEKFKKCYFANIFLNSR